MLSLTVFHIMLHIEVQLFKPFVLNWQSEKRKQDLLAEILLEEQHGRELSKVVKDLLPDPKNSVVEKPLRARKVP